MAPTNASKSSSDAVSGGPGDDEVVEEAAAEGDEGVEAVWEEFELIGAEEAAAAESRSDERVEASCWRLEGCFSSGHSSGSRCWGRDGGCPDETDEAE